jgi:hypothetical protein
MLEHIVLQKTDMPPARPGMEDNVKHGQRRVTEETRPPTPAAIGFLLDSILAAGGADVKEPAPGNLPPRYGEPATGFEVNLFL